MTSEPVRVWGVLVTYRPDADTLRAAVAAVRDQVAGLVVVDNSATDPDALDVAGALEALGVDGGAGGRVVQVVAQADNAGLAAAQNAGVAAARRAGATHVLFLDQDSFCAPGMVAQLSAALHRLGPRRPAAVGPRFRDPREATDAPFIRVAFPMSHKLYCSPGRAEIECDFLISSGSLVPLAVLEDVGGLDEGIFIDNVDLEWSFRARARGYRLFGVCSATMTHHLGDARVPILGGRLEVVRHSPVRLYYITRNRLMLYRLPWTPRVWIAQDVPRVVAKLLIHGLLVGPRRRNLRYMARGLLDAARRRSGRCPIGPAR